ncbi:hypothetical protein HMN09_00618100 [Mycena chlorophos]|uniref:Uncharacterized protein n=1 Tax=Mycena chlorophos TaxID=658473 RepID=A0A8H6T5S1_MYCCL|nr:hypothetical protein HMN09_00618100 [Mycena chlorophos]
MDSDNDQPPTKPPLFFASSDDEEDDIPMEAVGGPSDSERASSPLESRRDSSGIRQRVNGSTYDVRQRLRSSSQPAPTRLLLQRAFALPNTPGIGAEASNLIVAVDARPRRHSQAPPRHRAQSPSLVPRPSRPVPPPATCPPVPSRKAKRRYLMNAKPGLVSLQARAELPQLTCTVDSGPSTSTACPRERRPRLRTTQTADLRNSTHANCNANTSAGTHGTGERAGSAKIRGEYAAYMPLVLQNDLGVVSFRGLAIALVAAAEHDAASRGIGRVLVEVEVRIWASG